MSVVVYTSHRVVPLPRGVQEPGTVGLGEFSRRLRWLRRLGVRFVPIGRMLAWLRGETALPRLAAVLTFDDAYECVGRCVLPLMQTMEIPFTVFATVGLVGKASEFYVHKGGRPYRHMDVQELRCLLQSGLAEVGAHGFSHFDLRRATDEEIQREVVYAKHSLQEMLDTEVAYFSYPDGAVTDRSVQAVKSAGYKAAFTTRKARVTSQQASLMRLPRVNWGRHGTVLRLMKYHLMP